MSGPPIKTQLPVPGDRAPPRALDPQGSGREVSREKVPLGPRPSDRQRDFLLMTIFVLAQQGYIDRAGVLAEALYLTGETTPEVMLARAVLRFLAGEWSSTLACLEDLDRLDPVERFGSYRLTEPQRMRRFLAARCLFELGDRAKANDALEVYLRHGKNTEDFGNG